MRAAYHLIVGTSPLIQPLIQYWHSKTPPDYIVELLDTFAEQNPEMEHLVFSQASAEEFIETHFGAREVAAFEACTVPAMQADYFRYCAGYVLGGICVDADCRCLGPLLPLLEGPAQGVLFESRASVLANGVFAFRSPGHPLLAAAREISTELIDQRFPGSISAITGPGIFTCLLCIHKVGSIDAILRYLEDGTEPSAGGACDPAGLDLLRKLWRSQPIEAQAIFQTACRVLGGKDRLLEAFDGTRVELTSTRLMGLLHHATAEEGLAYKKTETHWPKARATIYRET